MDDRNYENNAGLRDVAEGSLREAVEGVEGGVRAGRDRVASAIDSGAKIILTGAEELEGQAAAASAKLSDGAAYVRNLTGAGVLRDVECLIARHPLAAIGVAGCCGALLGLALWRRSETQTG